MKRNLLREYLQYKILEVIFSSPYANALSFMGGTSIRIIHSSSRFSEDLDFDNRSVDRDGLELLTNLIHKRLSREGYEAEVKNTLRQILLKCKGLDFKQLVRDVALFLMNREDAEKILSFPEYIRTVRF